MSKRLPGYPDGGNYPILSRCLVGAKETSDQSLWPQTIAPGGPMLYLDVAAALNSEEPPR